jgi:4-hydroxy-3-polyprenylbenzoate decarboxylase
MSTGKSVATISVGMTGASGAQYGLRLIEWLIRSDRRVYLMLSKPAQLVIAAETDLKLPGRAGDIAQVLADRFGARAGQLQAFGTDEWTAPVASGSGVADAMVVCPCSMATLSSIAVGASRSLLERAADVTLKEGRKLILVPRETPLSAIHLENMLKLARLGVVMLPANPGFYSRPQNIAELIDFIVARVLDHLGVEHELAPRWGSEEGA